MTPAAEYRSRERLATGGVGMGIDGFMDVTQATARRVFMQPLGDHCGRDFEVKLQTVDPVSKSKRLMSALGRGGQELGSFGQVECLLVPMERDFRTGQTGKQGVAPRGFGK